MKKFTNKLLGVTLLEVLLVLAIAAMIIVMSVRYYQSASTSQQANAVLSQIQSIAAAADSISQAQASYTGLSDDKIQPLLPANGLTTPWGTEINTSDPSDTGYTVTFVGTPDAICQIVSTYLMQNPHYNSNIKKCNGKTVDFSYTYVANPDTSTHN